MSAVDAIDGHFDGDWRRVDKAIPSLPPPQGWLGAGPGRARATGARGLNPASPAQTIPKRNLAA